MKKIITIFLLTYLSSNLSAQLDMTLYFMDRVPQANYVNPAMDRSFSKINIGLPIISSLYFNYQNNIFTPKDLFDIENGTSTLRIDHLSDLWKDKNYMGISLRTDLIHIGFRFKEKNFITFNITENAFSRFTIPGDLLRFGFTGNADFDAHNGVVDLSDLGLDIRHYREYGLAIQHQYNDKISLGAKLKVLQGFADITTKKNDVKWITDPTTFDSRLEGGMEIYSSLILDSAATEDLETSDYFSTFQNKGVAFDFGATYQFNEKLNFSASIIDLGFIRWKRATNNGITNSIDFVYSGIDLTQTIFDSDSTQEADIDEQIDQYEDDLEDAFDIEGNHDAYNSWLPTRIHLGAQYKLYNTLRTSGTAGALLQTEFYKGTLRPSLTLSYTQNVGRWLQAAINYSYTNRDFRNLGLGLAFNAGALQMHIIADNLLALNYVEIKENAQSSDATPYPHYSKNIHFRFGINLTLGRKQYDRDQDGVIDKRDKCIDIKGIKELRGCPDTDGDGITDEEDACPNIPGEKSLNGCPDKDKDGITDGEDECPNEAGLKKYNGCPDKDKDGIPDHKDLCPELAGEQQYQGCPDTDGDGIPDNKDKCKNKKGPAENDGCPWPDRDNDGLIDNVDQCPDEKGPKENNGCPFKDSDGDGVKDDFDQCPNTPGSLENYGCPVVKKEQQAIIDAAFDNLEFETGKNVIKKSSYISLEKLAKLLAENPTWKLEIAGHTDNTGNDKKNMELSKKRTFAVAEFLTKKGVEDKQLIKQWFGETKPIADNNTAIGRQKNRRVELNLKFE